MNASEFLSMLGRTSVQAGALVLVVLLAQWTLRHRLAPRWRCALWLLVVVRLLLPVTLASPVSVFTWLPRTQATAPVVPKISLVVNAEQLAVEVGDPAEQPAAGVGTATAAMPPVSVGASPETHVVHRIPWLTLAIMTWLAGALVLLIHVLISSVRLARRMADLPPVTEPAVLGVLEDCRRLLGVRTRLAVVECAEMSSPALQGLFRPKLLLPKNFSVAFPPRELRYIFLHELAHLKRWDLWLNWLVVLLQALHWFNPLVWIGFARWRADRELACDALAIEAAGAGENREYGRTMLRLLENFVPRSAMPGMVGIFEDQQQLRQRVQMIARFRPGPRGAALVLLMVAAVIASCFNDPRPIQAAIPPTPTPAARPAPAKKPNGGLQGGLASLIAYEGFYYGPPGLNNFSNAPAQHGRLVAYEGFDHSPVIPGGRNVKLRLKQSGADPDTDTFRWVLTLKREPEPSSVPSEIKGKEELNTWFTDWLQTDAGKRWQRSQLGCWHHFDYQANGSFLAENVPPGKYRLTGELWKNGTRAVQMDFMAVEIPPAATNGPATTIDLGDLTVQTRQQPGKVTPSANTNAVTKTNSSRTVPELNISLGGSPSRGFIAYDGFDTPSATNGNYGWGMGWRAVPTNAPGKVLPANDAGTNAVVAPATAGGAPLMYEHYGASPPANDQTPLDREPVHLAVTKAVPIWPFNKRNLPPATETRTNAGPAAPRTETSGKTSVTRGGGLIAYEGFNYGPGMDLPGDFQWADGNRGTPQTNTPEHALRQHEEWMKMVAGTNGQRLLR